MVYQRSGQVSNVTPPVLESSQSGLRDRENESGQHQTGSVPYQSRQEPYVRTPMPQGAYQGQKLHRSEAKQDPTAGSCQHVPNARSIAQGSRNDSAYHKEGTKYQREPLAFQKDPLHLEHIDLHNARGEFNHESYFQEQGELRIDIDMFHSSVVQDSAEIFQGMSHQNTVKDNFMQPEDNTFRQTMAASHSNASASNTLVTNPQNSHHHNVVIQPSPSRSSTVPVEFVNLASDESEEECDDPVLHSSKSLPGSTSNVNPITSLSDFDISPPTPGGNISLSRGGDERERRIWEMPSDVEGQYSSRSWNSNQSSIRIDVSSATPRWTAQYSSDGTYSPRTPGWNISASSDPLPPNTHAWNFSSPDLEIVNEQSTNGLGQVPFESGCPSRPRSPEWFAMPHTPISVNVDVPLGSMHFENIDFPPPTPGNQEILTGHETQGMPPPVNVVTPQKHSVTSKREAVTPSQRGNCAAPTQKTPPQSQNAAWGTSGNSSGEEYSVEDASYRSPVWSIPPPTPGVAEVSEDVLEISPPCSPSTVDLTNSDSPLIENFSSARSKCDSPEVENLFPPDPPQALQRSPPKTTFETGASPQASPEMRDASKSGMNRDSALLSYDAPPSSEELPFVSQPSEETPGELPTPPPLEARTVEASALAERLQEKLSSDALEESNGGRRSLYFAPKTPMTTWDSPPSSSPPTASSPIPVVKSSGRSGKRAAAGKISKPRRRKKLDVSDDEEEDETWGKPKKRKPCQSRKGKRKRDDDVEDRNGPQEKKPRRKPRKRANVKNSSEEDLEVLEMRDEYDNGEDSDDEDYVNCSEPVKDAVDKNAQKCVTSNEESLRTNENNKDSAQKENLRTGCEKDRFDSKGKLSNESSFIGSDSKKGHNNPAMPPNNGTKSAGNVETDFIIDEIPIEINCGSKTFTLGPGVMHRTNASSADFHGKDQQLSKQKTVNLPDTVVVNKSLHSQDTILNNIASNSVSNSEEETSSSADPNANTTISAGSGSSRHESVTAECASKDVASRREARQERKHIQTNAKSAGKSSRKRRKGREKEKEAECEATDEAEDSEESDEEVGQGAQGGQGGGGGDGSPHEAARLRRRALAAAFIMHEAEEGDAAEDDDDDDWLDDGDGDEASEAAAAASAAEARRRRQRSESWRPLRAPSPSVSDILKRLRLGAAEDGASVAQARAVVPRSEPDQQALLPGVTDPCLWMIECCRAQERQAVVALMRKALCGRSGEPLRIHSVVFSGSATRYVYIEALRKQHAQAAVQDVAPLRAGRYKATQVPISEMPDVLKACRRVPLLRRGQWVRPKRGVYRDDVAEVVEVDPAEEYAVVRLLPRIDYSLLAPGGGMKPTTERSGPKRRRTPARRLDIDALRRAGVDVSAAAVTGEVLFNRDTYKDGFLVKRFPLKALTTAKPSLEETQAFGVDPEAGLLLSEDPEPWLGPGDDVEIKEGGLEGLRGRVLEVRGDTVTVDVADERIEDPVICAASELRKDFSVGARVRVVAGSHRGATGLVVKSDYERVYITEDETNREIEALVRHVRLATNSAPAEPAGGLRWADMVTLRDGSVGMVERVEGTSVRVLDAHGRLRAVDARAALLRGPHARPRPLLDCEQNEIRPRDAVEVVEGPRKGERGTVKGAYRGSAFIASDSVGDGRLFVARATHLRLQGGASDRCRMFLRQLDPDAAAEAAEAVGVCGATQPASPAPPDPRRHSMLTAVQPTPPPAGVCGLGPPPPPPPPKGASFRRADFDTFDRGLRRDRSLLGAVVIVTAGPYKGSVGTVRDASLASARVELYTPQQTIPVKREHLKVVEPPASGGGPRRLRAPAGSEPSPTRPAPFPLGGFYGTAGSATPHAPTSPRLLPAPGFGESPSSIPAGYRTPMVSMAATPMYDAGSRTPLPTPQSPAASAAVWEPRTPSSFLESGSPLSAGYMSLPLVYAPTAGCGVPGGAEAFGSPVAPPAPLPVAWPVPGLAVAVSTAPGLFEPATVRAVTRDGGVTMMMRSGTLVTLAATERVCPTAPAKGETCVVVGDGPHRGRRAVLANIDGADGVIRLENCLTMQLVPMAHLCRVADDEDALLPAADAPLA